MNQEQIIRLQIRVGTKPDGWWGPKSSAACEAHLKSMMPRRNPWPFPDQGSLLDFYGDPWDNSHIVRVDAPTWMRLYNTNRPLKSINVHERCAESLLRALDSAHKAAPEHTARFFGCHVDRVMRNGTLPSTHAHGAAIDLAASSNGNHTHWPTGADMPIEVMEAFAREGWTSAGAFWHRDAMHHQATRPR